MDALDPPMPDKTCQQAAYWRAEAVLQSAYDRNLAPAVFRDAYNDCVKWANGNKVRLDQNPPTGNAR